MKKSAQAASRDKTLLPMNNRRTKRTSLWHLRDLSTNHFAFVFVSCRDGAVFNIYRNVNCWNEKKICENTQPQPHTDTDSVVGFSSHLILGDRRSALSVTLAMRDNLNRCAREVHYNYRQVKRKWIYATTECWSPETTFIGIIISWQTDRYLSPSAVHDDDNDDDLIICTCKMQLTHSNLAVCIGFCSMHDGWIISRKSPMQFVSIKHLWQPIIALERTANTLSFFDSIMTDELREAKTPQLIEFNISTRAMLSLHKPPRCGAWNA